MSSQPEVRPLRATELISRVASACLFRRPQDSLPSTNEHQIKMSETITVAATKLLRHQNLVHLEDLQTVP